MLLQRSLLLLLTAAACASLTGAFPAEPVQALKPGAGASSKVGSERDEREQARQEFIEARTEFADILASVMTTEQFAARARELSVEVRFKQAQDRLKLVEKRLEIVEREGRRDSDEAKRLQSRLKTLQAEVESLTELLDGRVKAQDEVLVTKVIVGQFKMRMADETEYLADVLETRELKNRAEQLRQMVKLGQFASGVAGLQEEPQLIDEAPPELIKADEESEL